MNTEVTSGGDSCLIPAAAEAANQAFNKDFIFRSVFKHAPIGMAVIALNGRFLKVNRSLSETLGFNEQEFYATTVQSLSHPHDLEEDLNRAQGLLDGTASTYKMEKRFLNKAGQAIWILLSASIVRNQTGAPLFFISQMQTIDRPTRLEQTPMGPLGDPKQLQGVVPICMYCKNIRAERDRWQKVEAYVTQHTRAKFSHCVCPECMNKFKNDLAAEPQA
jgi:PAS domain S-box-containing protein